MRPSTAEPLHVDRLIGDLDNGWSKLQRICKGLERQLLERAVREKGDLPNEEIAVLLGTSRRVLELRLQEFGVQKPQTRKAPADAPPTTNGSSRGTAVTGSIR